MKIHVGIDLGTTNSVCCTLKHGKFNFLKFKGKELLPSAILWQDGKIIVGEKARAKSVIYADHFICSSKTFMGDFEKKWSIDGREFTPTDVATEVLAHIKHEIVKTWGTDGITAVITVPAYFTANQINETKTAGEKAGFQVKQIITEPVAAAIAYGFEDQEDQQLFVVDIGGGTFDVSILEIKGNRFQTFHIDGDKKLGGDNFDEIILDLFFKKIRQSAGIDFSSFEKSGISREDFFQAKQRLFIEAEKLKVELSEVENVKTEIPNLFTYKNKPYNFSFELSRKQFEEEAKPLLNKVKRIISNCLEDSTIPPSAIDKIILVGGTSYMPIIQSFIQELLGKNPYADRDLSTLVAKGAALVADDESDAIRDIVDIISHSLGIVIIGEKFEKILVKNDPYPISKSKLFTTIIDNQEEVEINIFEGEDEGHVENNEFYGGLTLGNIEKAKAGTPKIEVHFAFDKSRDLHVTAKDLTTGSQKSKTVQIHKGVKRENPIPPSIDIMFVIDTTGSMEPYIKGVMDTCHEFANTIAEKSINIRLGLIGFGDEPIGEYPTIYALTDDIDKFKQNVNNCPRTGGGDLPESSFEAIDDAIRQLKASNNKKIIILITDAPAHSPSMTGKGEFKPQEILKSLKEQSITTYIVGSQEDYYQNFANSTSGKFFIISDYRKFVNIIQEIAVDISSLTTYKG